MAYTPKQVRLSLKDFLYCPTNDTVCNLKIDPYEASDDLRVVLESRQTGAKTYVTATNEGEIAGYVGFVVPKNELETMGYRYTLQRSPEDANEWANEAHGLIYPDGA